MNSLNKHIVIFDGECGFCHRWIRIFIKFDPNLNFYFCPRQNVANGIELREKVGESITVYTKSGELLTYSNAVLFILSELEGFPRWIGKVLTLVPKWIRDFGYGCISAVRHRLSQKPSELCPMVPAEQRSRFLSHLSEVAIPHS